MTQRSLLWHDYETWGVSPSQDKPSQFAGIRTDENLNIIGEPLMFYCQPNSDCLPHPEACLVTGLSPQQAAQKGLPEPEFMANIHDQMAQKGTCGVGYNSIRFDDEVTRYGLYRNFFEPYTREHSNGNSRWDIIDMVRMVYALRPDTLQWPKNEDGTPSFRLELLSAANGLAHESAHDALSDVYATIELARLIKQRQPKLYEYAYSLRFKQVVDQQIDLARRKPFLHISSRFPSSNGCAAIVVPLMRHPSNKNSIICYDLSKNPQALLNESAEVLYDKLYTKTEDLNVGEERLALKEIHLNKSPMVVTLKMLDDATASRLNIDRALCEQHWQQLLNVDLSEKLSSVYQRKAFKASNDPEQQLYDGFIPKGDQPIMTAIRQSDGTDLDQFQNQLQDKRLQTLLFRYRARFYPQSLNTEELEQWEHWRYSRLTDPEFGASIVLDEYFERLQHLELQPNVNKALIQALYDYGDGVLGG